MAALALARWQFAVTTVYHFFFVPLTLGLSILVAIMETLYVRSGDEVYKRMTKFWGKLFLINFAMGVATGIVQEFQFGMNWAEYSRFVGDLFGAPLAIEALLAFFMESTFLGIWIFGWDRLPKWLHAGVMWLVALGSNLSALWILVASSFMHEPVGYTLRNGRAEMTDFWALLGNPHVWVQWPHVLTSAMTTAAFFVLGISAYHLLRQKEGSRDQVGFRRSFRMALVIGLVGVVLAGGVGHIQAQHLVEAQPMKLAAGEGLWDGEDPAPMSLVAIFSETERRNIFAIELPAVASLLAYNKPEGRIEGINDLQAEYEQRYGPGNYVPPVTITYWSFRVMMGLGVLMFFLAALGVYLVFQGRRKKQPQRHTRLGTTVLKLLAWSIPLPYLANSAGWILTEVGRQPWIVFGLMRVEDGVSLAVSPGAVLFSLLLFAFIYAALMLFDIYLLAKFARRGVAPAEELHPLAAAEG